MPSRIAADGDCEGLPTVVLESIRAGLPVVATNHAGIPEIIRDQNTGFLVPENDPDAGFWFTLVPSQIVDYVGVPSPVITGYYADALRTSELMTLPIGAKTELNLRNAHLSYAMTWYGIALALVGVYGAFHYQTGRLRLGRKTQQG